MPSEIVRLIFEEVEDSQSLMALSQASSRQNDFSTDPLQKMMERRSIKFYPASRNAPDVPNPCVYITIPTTE